MSLLWKTAVKETYYHASHRDLPVGTVLEDQGLGMHPYAPKGVFMSRDLDTAHDWAHNLGNHHVYEVEPEGPIEKRYQKDALGEHEWIAPRARITRKVGTVDPDGDHDYCDGCLA